MPRRGRGRRRNAPEEGGSSDDDGVLRIGGVCLRVDAVGNIAGVTRSGHGQRVPLQRFGGRRAQPARPHLPTPAETLSDSESREEADLDSDADVEDYLQNVAAASDEDGPHHGHQAAWRQLQLLRRFSGVELGHEGAVEDIGWNSEDDDETSEDGSSSSSFSSDGGPSDGIFNSVGRAELAELRGIDSGVLTLEEMEEMPPELRYPVSVRPRPTPPPPPPSAGKQAGGEKKRRPGVKGAKSGKLAPGEKAQLRRQGIEAKRASRAVARGFDLAWVNKQLQDMVAKEYDVHAFPPMGKHECREVLRLATLYGCKASTQGSGKKRPVVVAATARTALPLGDALLEVGRLLAAQNAADLGRAGAGVPGGSGGGRWGRVRRGGKGPTGSQPKRDHVRGGPGGAAGFNRPPPANRKLAQPVAFVSRGAIDPSESSVEVVLRSRGEPAGAAADGPESAPAGQHLLLHVYEDLQGSSPSEEGDAGDGLGHGAAKLGQPPGSKRGEAAAEGMTNPGRLLQLGMALGIGAEVFGAAGPAADGDGGADLSPLHPKPSNSAQQQLGRRKARRAQLEGLSRQQEAPQQLSKGGRSKKERGKRTASSAEAEVAAPVQHGDYAYFERHTTGIGSKLLSKWGFAGAGAGLGRNGEGIAEPLHAGRRAKGQGLGA